MDLFVAWSENIAEATEMATAEQHPLEQLLVTQDETDYLFYHTKVSVPVSDDNAFVVGSRQSCGQFFIDFC